MKKTFKGVAYYTGSNLPANFGERAVHVLSEPLQTVKGEVTSESNDAGQQRINIGFGDDVIEMRIDDGRTQGIVRDTPSAGAIVMCLMALKQTVSNGHIDIVDDDENPIPTRVRQSFPLYSKDWERNYALAQVLGLAINPQFAQQHAGLLNRVF